MQQSSKQQLNRAELQPAPGQLGEPRESAGSGWFVDEWFNPFNPSLLGGFTYP